MSAPMKEKLIQLLDMGFSNFMTNLQALSMTRENLDKAMELILEKSK